MNKVNVKWPFSLLFSILFFSSSDPNNNKDKKNSVLFLQYICGFSRWKEFFQLSLEFHFMSFVLVNVGCWIQLHSIRPSILHTSYVSHRVFNVTTNNLQRYSSKRVDGQMEGKIEDWKGNGTIFVYALQVRGEHCIEHCTYLQYNVQQIHYLIGDWSSLECSRVPVFPFFELGLEWNFKVFESSSIEY